MKRGKDSRRESFSGRFGLLATMIGVAVGLGNVWRFPYMVGRFGGASFVLVYVVAVVGIGIPCLMGEWALGRRTRRGPVGAFRKAGFPGGRWIGWGFFGVVAAATAYYSNAVGWVLYYALGEVAGAAGLPWSDGAVLPPESGVELRSLGLQMLCTGLVVVSCCLVLVRGLRAGIERVSRFVMPLLSVILVVLIFRALTLPGAWAGVRWYILKFEPAALTAPAVMAALGHAFFSLSLGGTFMVVYGSYLSEEERLEPGAIWTALGDLGAGLLAGLAVFPAVFAFGLEPSVGPELLFATLPGVFDAMPAGWVFGLLFFTGLLGAAYLSDVGAFEVLVAGLVDGTGMRRARAVWFIAGVVYLLALPPMLNMRVFVPWDLTFGSGMQTLGALLAALAVGWSLSRAEVLRQLGGAERPRIVWLYRWLRYAVPAILLAIGGWWLWSEVLSS